MGVTIGSRFGPYEIVAPLGSGGMGEVYRARDTKLNRDVAIKVLLSSVAHDADRLSRFGREAQLLAALNHPNIAHIHGLEDAEGVQALVMELVEGPTLADRIAQGRIPVEEALPIARQIAEALEAAHAQGIIHRDLKPANIKVRADGTVKVLDFGLAKALDPLGASSADATISPTLSLHATQSGVILGTAAYMSPEQARGRVVDARADIWAFGCVVFEMLTAQRAFQGDDVTDTIVAVVSKEPDWKALPAAASSIRPLLVRCLKKDSRQRLQAIGDARIALDDIGKGESAESALTMSTAPPTRRAAWVSFASALGGALLATAVLWMRLAPTSERAPRPTKFELISPSQPFVMNGADRNIAISPDGSLVVYRGGSGLPQLVARRLDSLDARPLAGTTNARQPFFSPDGQWVGFFEGRSLKKVPVSGGQAITIVPDIAIPRGASWDVDNTIVFTTQDGSTGVSRVSANGGEPRILTTPDTSAGEVNHWYPALLPDGRGVLFTLTAPNRGDSAQVAVLNLKSGERKILFRGSNAEYLSSGHLLFAMGGSAYLVRFDLERLEVIGNPVPVIDELFTTTGGWANYAVSPRGTLVYVPGRSLPPRSLVWVDRSGHETPLPVPPRPFIGVRLSPDGTRVALTIREDDTDIWVWEIGRQTLSRLTFDPGPDAAPVWTSDGERIIYASVRASPDAAENLFIRAADGTGAISRLTSGTDYLSPTGAPARADDIIGFAISARSGADVVRFQRRDATAPAPADATTGLLSVEPIIRTRSIEMDPDLSPNGRYLAYSSDESGPTEIFVCPYPGVADGRWQISRGGGSEPTWSRTGRELFYLDLSGRLMVVPVDTTGERFVARNPVKAFDATYASRFSNRRSYDVSPDGLRFLVIKELNGQDNPAGRQNIVVVTNWFEELKGKVQ